MNPFIAQAGVDAKTACAEKSGVRGQRRNTPPQVFDGGIPQPHVSGPMRYHDKTGLSANIDVLGCLHFHIRCSKVAISKSAKRAIAAQRTLRKGTVCFSLPIPIVTSFACTSCIFSIFSSPTQSNISLIMSKGFCSFLSSFRSLAWLRRRSFKGP